MTLIGFEAAKPKGLRAPDAPTVVPMRPRDPSRQQPSTDQKKTRREMQRSMQSTPRTALSVTAGDLPAFTRPVPNALSPPKATDG